MNQSLINLNKTNIYLLYVYLIYRFGYVARKVWHSRYEERKFISSVKKLIHKNITIGQEKWHMFLDAPLSVQVPLGICS